MQPLLEALFRGPTPSLRRSLVLCICRVAADPTAAEELSNAGALLALTGQFDAKDIFPLFFFYYFFWKQKKFA